MARSRITAEARMRASEATVLGLLERNAATAVDRAGEVALAAVRGTVPVGTTGDLKGSLRKRRGRPARGVSVTVAPNFREAYYAGMVDQGTVKMEGRHYMDRAAEQADSAAVRTLEDGADHASDDIERILT